MTVSAINIQGVTTAMIALYLNVSLLGRRQDSALKNINYGDF